MLNMSVYKTNLTKYFLQESLCRPPFDVPKTGIYVQIYAFHRRMVSPKPVDQLKIKYSKY